MPSRYIRHSSREPAFLDVQKCDIGVAFKQTLERLQRHTPDVNQGYVDPYIYVGISGVAFLNVELAKSSPSMLPQLLPPSLSPSKLRGFALRYLLIALSSSRSLSSPRDAAHASFLETSVGLAAIVLSLSISDDFVGTEEIDQLSSHCDKSLRVISSALELAKYNDGTDDGCEVLYGRAGLLYALLFLRQHVPLQTFTTDGSIARRIQDLASDSVLSAVVDSIIKCGKRGAAEYVQGIPKRSSLKTPALMWSWHGKRYLGAAHGVAGILHTLLHCPVSVINQHVPLIMDTVEWLVDVQDDTGNWPSKAPRDLTIQSNDLVQWCHGATGVLILLSTVLTHSSSPRPRVKCSSSLVDKLVSSVTRGAALVYRHGFLRKGVGLCHGTGGSVYALLACHRAFSALSSASSPALRRRYEDDFLMQATHLAHLATRYQELTRQGELQTPDRPWSLYEGIGGILPAWAAILITWEGDASCVNGMIGFDDLSLTDRQI